MVFCWIKCLQVESLHAHSAIGKKSSLESIELTSGFVRLQQLDREATIEIDQQYQSLENS